jgi:uncharacterized protein (DUF342 family)
MDSLPSPLADLLRQTEAFVGSLESVFAAGVLPSVQERLRGALSKATDPDRRRRLTSILARLKEVLASPVAAGAEPLLRLEESPTEARLTLLPGPKGKIDLAFILKELDKRGIREKVSREAIQAACEAVDQNELVYGLKIAEGVPAENGQDATIEFCVRAFDKRILMDPQQPFVGDLAAQVEAVEAGRRAAVLTPAKPGRPGLDLRGRPVPCLPVSELPLRLGTGLRLAPNGQDLHAALAGTLVAGDGMLDVVPFRVFEGGIRSSEKIDFPGHILVTGHVSGQANLRGRDIFIEGNVEEASIWASGDVLVGGALQSKSRIQSEGLVLARQISDATVEALGDVLVRNSIVEGRVISSGVVRLVDPQGAIEGGSVSSRKGIRAGALGSDWGIETSVSAGRDVLGTARAPEVDRGIADCEEELRRMGRLLPPSLEAGADLVEIPIEEQGACANTLERAAQALRNLSNFRRSKERIQRVRGDYSRATVEVTGPIHPPVKVEIGPAVQMFRKRLDHVILVLGHNKRIRVKEETPTRRAERKTKTRRRG